MIRFRTTLAICLTALTFALCHAQTGQLSIGRLSGIGNAPSPYLMRDWKKIAQQYDSLVYNKNISGQYLPLIFTQAGGINYPQQEKFGLHTFVGTFSPQGNEAINVLPSLVGASLCGIDKTNQWGKNWVKMSFDFFNLKNGEGLYLNGASTQSGNDWWYDVMPNLYFYQLYDLYDGIDATAKDQFVSVAQQFSRAVRAMGGHDAPWTRPNMNYRAWKFKEMKPLTTGVKEPESAGSMAWVLYHAWKETGDPEYLKTCEWAMEFLNTWESNPSFELQLPYGVYTAAKMNAELNTRYDINKLLNWCFDRGPLRGWGCIKGKWGGLDVTGLIGEANDTGNDYAFQMNGLHQAAALVPMVRYDKRFARDIARWVLHLANANRLFYHGFLPSDQQDASAWSSVYDGKQVMGYEALRQVWQGKSPFSTGDALKSGWSATNLALYGTSSIGYLGSIIEKTNVDKVLRLDLLKTDFFRDTAYPTYVYYNPGNQTATLSVDLGNTAVDVYETLSEKFILREASGLQSIQVPANEAIMVVLCPTGGTVDFQFNRMMVNGVTVDYAQSQTPYRFAPRIQALAADSIVVQQGKSITIYCRATDADSPQLTYEWLADKGNLQPSNDRAVYQAPQEEGTVVLQCVVKDETGQADTATLQLQVVQKINIPPVVPNIQTDRSMITPGANARLWCDATDEDGDTLQYEWKTDGGELTYNGPEAFFTAAASGVYTIELLVTDGHHAPQKRTQKILVKNYTEEKFNALAYYDFAGNTTDKSGNALHGTAKGVILTADKDNRAQQAYYFNGGNQHILVANAPLLNFTEAISVCTWFKPISLPEKETFLVSHGSWQERWKLSITQERKLRWTLNTATGIADLDGISPILNDQYYHVCTGYDGEDMLIYINGRLENFKKHSGALNKTTKALTIGQMIPESAEYNFKGIIDEVVIYAHMIGPSQVSEVFEQGVISQVEELPGDQWEVYPNPFTHQLTLRRRGSYHEPCTLELMNLSGAIIKSLPIAETETVVETDDLMSGYYILRIKDKNGIVRMPMVKVK